jgi:lipopolysaccharide export system protein LptA
LKTEAVKLRRRIGWSLVLAVAIASASASAQEHHHDNATQPASGGRTDSTDNRGFSGLSLSSGNGPIHIDADSLAVDSKSNVMVWRGHVHAVQSGTDLTSDVLQVSYGKDFHEIKQAVADGNVRVTQGGRWATGDHAVLDQTARTIEMTGSPVIHDGPDQITGTKILVYLDSQKSVVEGARAVIFPRKQETHDNIKDVDNGAERKD